MRHASCLGLKELIIPNFWQLLLRFKPREAIFLNIGSWTD